MFNIIQDPTVTPKELAFCYRELQTKEEKLITEKKLFHEQLLSLQRNVREGEISEPESDSNIKKQIEQKKSRIKNIIIECEAILVDMEQIRTRMAHLIPQAAKKRLDEIREAESHSFTKKKRKIFRTFLLSVARAVVIKQDIDGRQGSNYNFEFKFNSLGDRDKKFFINEIKRIRDEAVDNGEIIAGANELDDEKIELEKAVKEGPFTQVDKLLKEVGAKVRNR
jgi:hypothetical protein